MTARNQNGKITRRGFLQFSSGAFATTGMLAGVGDAKATPNTGERQNLAKTDPTLMTGKVALEEHFAFSDGSDAGYNVQPTSEFRQQMQDMGSGRIADMDRWGVELCILSHVGPGIRPFLIPRKRSSRRSAGMAISQRT